jgi:hypothetical protein
MARLKIYQYQDITIKAYNKEDARRKLRLPFMKQKEIKKIWCRSYKRGLYVKK